MAALAERLAEGRIQRRIRVPVEGQGLRSRLFDLGVVVSEVAEEDGSSCLEVDLDRRDRKSTRLNSSHVAISYAVFCLKRKIRLGGSLCVSSLISCDTVK